MGLIWIYLYCWWWIKRTNLSEKSTLKRPRIDPYMTHLCNILGPTGDTRKNLSKAMYDKFSPGLRNAGSNPQEVLICCQVSQVQNGTPEWSTAQGWIKIWLWHFCLQPIQVTPPDLRYFSRAHFTCDSHIYMSYIWVNYNDLTATSLEIMVSTGNDPQMAQQFRLVKYYHLPRYMYRLNCSWRCPRFPGQILCVLLSDSPSQKLQTMIGPDVCHSHPAITRLAYLQTTPALNSTYRII